ncbi:MAG: hypothetical protein E6K71_02840 [Candidatus Eisenbacteria bacterium]|uniref:MASE1 domain-containing protein n=1 Tax=Eiseniibacteriota bacterium TaxID=2212470 RepID=A0A538SG45_UNCEI|nr:MAG: hypothetical protein E6K71_02840 [Candidatus Eisenbacteria bacterium]
MKVPRPSGQDILAYLLVTAAYVVAGKVGLRLASVNASATAVWPPTGIALAAFLLLGPRIWPSVLLGAFLVNVTTAGTPATSLGIAVGNTLEGLLGSHLVRRFAGGLRVFDQPSTIFKFAALAGILAPAVSATIGATTLMRGGLAHWSDLGPIWVTWWLGDAAGALVVTPLVMLWWLDHELTWTPRRWVEYSVLLLTLVASAFFVFSSWSPVEGKRYPIQYFCLPPLLWSSFRFGQRESAAGRRPCGRSTRSWNTGWWNVPSRSGARTRSSARRRRSGHASAASSSEARPAFAKPSARRAWGAGNGISRGTRSGGRRSSTRSTESIRLPSPRATRATWVSSILRIAPMPRRSCPRRLRPSGRSPSSTGSFARTEASGSCWDRGTSSWTRAASPPA